jgi:hypothetical protein
MSHKFFDNPKRFAFGTSHFGILGTGVCVALRDAGIAKHFLGFD